MPGLDGTGPVGRGPATGRRLGRCTGNYAGYGFGRGFGRSMGFGGRFRGYGSSPVNAADEKAEIQAQIQNLQRQMDGLKKRLENL